MEQKNANVTALTGNQNVQNISKNNLLHKAVESGDAERVKYLINVGHGIDEKSIFGQTPLMLAVKHNYEYIFEILIKAGADIEIESHICHSVLETIGKSNRVTEKILNLCLQKIYKDYSNNKEEIAEKLIEANWVLSNVVKLSDPDLTKIMLQRGYTRSIDSSSAIFKYRQTALHDAVRSVDIENVKVLLEYNANVNVSDTRSRTPLFYVYYHGKIQASSVDNQEYVNDTHSEKRLEILKLLLSRGAKLFTGHASYSELDGAYDIFKYGCEEAVNLLLQSGIDLTLSVGTFNDTAIHALASNKNSNIIQVLRDKIFDLELRDGHGMTPLMMAAQYGNYHAIEFFLNKGAEINAKNHGNITAICYALYRNNITQHLPQVGTEQQYKKCIQFLLERNADVQMRIQVQFFKSIFGRVTSNNWHSLGELVISHLAFKEMQETSFITQLIRDQIVSNDQFKSYFDFSKRQLEMKINESITLFDILTARDKKFELYACNKELISKIQDTISALSDNYYLETILQKRLSKACNMIALKKEAGGIICNIMGTSYEQFPLIADNIISYLEQKDMENLLATLL